MKIRSVLLASAAFASGAAASDEIFAKSYDMLNGETGSFTYWDDSYNGSGNTTQSGSQLSGGLGDLTDGVIATQNWNFTPGPYVGWNTITPVITFHFDGVVDLSSVSLFLDDSNGAGGVAPPSLVRLVMGGVSIDRPIADPPSGAPFVFTADQLGLTGDTLDVTLFDGAGSWVFLSEVKFNGTVPTPGALASFGIAGLALGRRRR